MSEIKYAIFLANLYLVALHALLRRSRSSWMLCMQTLRRAHPPSLLHSQRSETTDLIVEITLQPWESFKPDGLILFSDILTPLPAIGVDFEVLPPSTGAVTLRDPARYCRSRPAARL